MNRKRRRGYTIEENRAKRLKKDVISFDFIIENLKNSHGRARSVRENALIVQAIAYFQNKSFTLDQSCKECSIMFKGCPKVYKNLWNYYIATGDLNISDTHEQRGIKPRKVFEIHDLDDDERDPILHFAFDYTV